MLRFRSFGQKPVYHEVCGGFVRDEEAHRERTFLSDGAVGQSYLVCDAVGHFGSDSDFGELQTRVPAIHLVLGVPVVSGVVVLDDSDDAVIGQAVYELLGCFRLL